MIYVYDFENADPSNKDLMGGKGAGLAGMTRIGLPVPPGFTVTTEACREYLRLDRFPDKMWEEVLLALRRLETRSGRHFGSGPWTPLLLSVRSGAKFSMPGMMDTVLNLGINDDVVVDLERWSGDRHFAWDAYRRFIQTFGKVVLNVPGDAFEEVLAALRAEAAVDDDSQLSAEMLERATREFQEVVSAHGHEPIPNDPVDQLERAVTAVFESWNNQRAYRYRRLHSISHDLGTAANVQMMVFGDLGDDSGTGVCFTRDPATGENVPYGDYLPKAQGEDVVAGIRNTLRLEELSGRHPENHMQLLKVMQTLEDDYKDMCDIEFTIEREKLWILQTRIGKRTARAAIRIATDLVAEGAIERKEALRRVDPYSLDQLLHPQVDPDLEMEPLAKGVAASPGAAVGMAVFDSDRAEEWAADGKTVVLVRWETTPDDIGGMVASAGILTSHGGKTSHAAVVARGMGKPAVTGVGALAVDEAARTATVGDVVIGEGDVVTIDGGFGNVYLGEIELIEPEPTPELQDLLQWADGYRRLGVRANADTPADAAIARMWGAEGIGLARTEHMFLGDRLPIVRNLILSDDEGERKAALDELRRVQTEDFHGILEAMDGKPVIVRLLDPPLHEFLPNLVDLERERAKLIAAGEDPSATEKLIADVTPWQEANPMLGLRGVRLGLVMPEIYLMQVRAALDAVIARYEAGGSPMLEIMIPLVSAAEELHWIRGLMETEMQEAEERAGRDLGVKIGTMIETPRAAVTAAEIAEAADFFSFGTNDLTQMSFGYSRDDAEGSFLTVYLEDGVLAINPFEHLDRRGVGRLLEMAVADIKATDPTLETGVCGEHGGDPESIWFCHEVGLDYVSCSPPRVAVARLAAAQAAIGDTSSASSV
jgi:pyruvate,orthophosphate dikinase